MNKLWREVFAGAPIILLGAGFAVWGGLNYNLIRPNGVIGPGFLPLVSGLVVAFFGCTGVVNACRQELKALKDRNAADADREPTEESRSALTVLLVFAVMAAAIALAPIIGLFLSFALMVFVLITFVEREKARYAVVLAAGVTLVSWLVFYEMLHVAMPIPFINFIAGLL